MLDVNKSINWYLVDSALTKAAITYPLSDNLATLQKTAAFPGAVLLVGQAGEVVYHKAFGCRSVLPEPSGMAADMIFDIASLTKALITTTIAMRLVEQGKLRLEDKIAKIFPKFEAHGKEEMSVLNLLTHTSGYAATAPFYKFINNNTALSNRAAIDIVYNEVFRTKLENMCGRVTKYSDIGFILLGHVLEEVSGLTLDKLAVKHVIAPLQLAHTGYIDLRNSQLAPNSDIIVPTAKCPWRQRILCAEVHDDNAWAMGGIAAHSGIFSNALDLHQFAFEMIECYHGRGGLINKEVMKLFWTPALVDPESTWALGWDTPSKVGSSAGKYFSKSTVGHLGFTGCSMWIDPEKELAVILLTNRVHPSVDNLLIREFRPIVHNLVMQALGYGI